MDNIDNEIQNIINYELNNGRKKLISKIQGVNFRYNSFNLCIGPQGSSKSCSVMKELMKLSYVPNDYHLIIYVSNNESDDTVNSLCKYVSLPIVKCDYEEVEEKLKKIIYLKDEYNKMIDGKIPKNEHILKPLFINDFSKDRLHTFVLFDDAGFIFEKNTKSEIKKYLCQLRHLNMTVFCCIQIFNSIDPKLKSQLSSVYLFKGFSRERLQYIYRQTPGIDMTFEEFFSLYSKLEKYQKIIVDCLSNETKMVS